VGAAIFSLTLRRASEPPINRINRRAITLCISNPNRAALNDSANKGFSIRISNDAPHAPSHQQLQNTNGSRLSVPVETVFAFSQSVIYRTEQIEISIWDIRDLSPLHQLTHGIEGLRQPAFQML
jgi:hypothetical protein